jgi:alpha-ketoglutarate-dependent taurine dioxygenase
MPMIGLDPRGRIREIRFNHRSLQPLSLTYGDGLLEPAEADAFYRAYLAFAEILQWPELMLTFRLSPGDCIAFDNTRVLRADRLYLGRPSAPAGLLRRSRRRGVRAGGAPRSEPEPRR